jgi:hypothetical protein
VEGAFRVWIGERQLDGVEWLDEATLRVEVPAGLAVGRHDVVVEGPFGRGTLPLAYEVLPGEPAALRAVASSPAMATVGQELAVSLAIENAGGVALTVVPAATATGAGGLELVGAPLEQELLPGEARTFSWWCRAVSPGEVSLAFTARGTDPRVLAPIEATATASLVVQRPAALLALARVDATTTVVGQPFAVTVEVTNVGGAAARGAATAPVVLAFAAPAGAPPPAHDLAPGETASFVWTYVATAAGAGAVAFDATATDGNTGRPIAATRAATPSVTALQPAAIGVVWATVTPQPPQVSAGQDVTASLRVENTGGAAATLLPSVAVQGTAVLGVLAGPAAQRVEPGSAWTFTWTFRASGTGVATFDLRASGVDEAGGLPVSASAAAGPVTVQSPAFLSATARAMPDVVSVGQPVEVALTVTNSGGAAASVTPRLASSGAALGILSAPAPRHVPGGETATFTWTLTADAAGDAALALSAEGHDENSGLPATAFAPATLHVEVPPRLQAELFAAPDPANTGQEIVVRMRVSNSGEAPALGVAPGALAQEGGGAATPLSGPSPASATLTGGASTWFEWRHVGSRSGALSFSAGAAGVDGRSGVRVAAPVATSPSIDVLGAATLALQFVTAPARVNVGQAFRAEVDVSNTGDSTALAVAAELDASPASALAVGVAPPPVNVAGGASARVAQWFTGASPATVTLSAAASGEDATDGHVVSGSRVGPQVVVERGAALSATLSIPASIPLGELTATLTVSNGGDAMARDVFPELSIEPDSTAAVEIVSGPAQPVSIAGGRVATFTWTCRASATGSLQLSAAVAGTDANDGAAVSARGRSDVAQIREIARVVAADPFADGSPFAFVTAYRGQVWLGPSRYGRGLVRMAPDATGLQSVSLSFARDVSGSNVSTNDATPYSSIGYTGCSTDSAWNACGPDNENGRGLLESVTFAGDEWLVLGGARTGGELDYVYMTRGEGSALSFDYVDLSSVLGGNTRGFASALGVGNRLYLGFPDNGGNRPYGLALLAPPSSPGLNTSSGVNVIDLDLGEAFKKALGTYASIATVDAIAALNGRVYFFDDIGCIVSKTAEPRDDEDFVGCSPTASAAYVADQAVEPTRQHDVEPRERAWPQVAVWNGALYAIRNTYTGPQLWACDLARGATPTVCEPGDWSLVAAEGAYRTRLGRPDVTSATLLVATPTHLYVGFDDPVRGIHVYRTSVARPTQASDFSGHDGCVAGSSTCEGLGGDGFGEGARLARIFDATTIASPGHTDLYLTAGNGTDAVRVVRISE